MAPCLPIGVRTISIAVPLEQTAASGSPDYRTFEASLKSTSRKLRSLKTVIVLADTRDPFRHGQLKNLSWIIPYVRLRVESI